MKAISPERKKLLDNAEELEVCKGSAWYFITGYCYTLDNETGKIALIPEWDYLHEFIEALQDGYSVKFKKTRRLLVTWAACAFELWGLTFRENWPCFNLSRKEEEVDDKTPNSIHGKIKFAFDRLPIFLKKNIVFNYLRIDNKDNGSFAKGESANEDAGRGGGFAFGLIDEAASIPYGEATFASFLPACKQKCMVSTSKGPKTAFARLFNMVLEGWKTLFYTWRDRPDRDEAYYLRETAGMLPAQKAREFDGIDSDDTIGVVWPMFKPAEHIKQNLFDKLLPVVLSFDFGYNDPTAIKFIQSAGGEARIVRDYAASGKTVEEIVKDLTAEMISLGVFKAGQKSYADVWGKIEATGDPAGNARGQGTGISLITQYKNATRDTAGQGGLRINTPTRSDVQAGIQEIGMRLGKKLLFVDSTCTRTIEELTSCHYPIDRRTGEVLDGEKYEHDEYSHGADAISYYCQKNPINKVKQVILPATDYYADTYFAGGRV